MPRSREILLPRDSQPQEWTGIDGEGLGAGLRRAINSAVLASVEQAEQSPITRLSGGSIASPIVAGDYGLAVQLDNALYNGIVQTPGWTDRTGEATFCLIFDRDAAGDTGCWELGAAAGDEFPFSAQAYFDVAWSSRWGNAINPPSGAGFGDRVVLHFCVKDGEQRAYWNGQLWHSNTATGGFGIPATLIWGKPTLKGKFYGGFGWERFLSAGEVAAHYALPWSPFAPQTIWVPVSAGGGGTVTLAAQDAAHAHALDNAALSIGVTLTVADLAHGHALDASTLSTGTALAVADSLHAHALDNVTLSTTGATSLTVADSLHAHALDNVGLTSDAYLAVADMLHAHALDNVGLTSDAYLAVADSLHAHALDNVGLTSDAYLAVADMLHAHALNGGTLTLGGIDLVIAGVMHAHALDTLALTLDTYLAIADALHAHALDNADLSLDTYLVVADALHAHAIDNLTLSFPATGALSDAEFRQMYDWLYALSQKQLLTVGTFLALK